MKILLVVALVSVLAALAGAGLMMLMRPQSPGETPRPDARMARALAIRVALSIALFLFILLSWHLGWISPQGVPVG